MNENETIVKDEQSNTVEHVKEEPITQENTHPEKKNVLSKIPGILSVIVITLAAALLVFGFIHLGFDQEQAITEFIFALVGVVVAVAMLLISPSASQRDTINAKNKTYIAVIGNAVCVIILSIVVLIGVLVGFRNAFVYRDEEHITANLCGLYEYNGMFYIINNDVIYKLDYEKLFMLDSISDEELEQRLGVLDDITIEQYLEHYSEYITEYTSLKYNYKKATLKFEEGTINVDRGRNIFLNGDKFKRLISAIDTPRSPAEFTEEFDIIAERYNELKYNKIHSVGEYINALKICFDEMNDWERAGARFYTSNGRYDGYHGMYSYDEDSLMFVLNDDHYYASTNDTLTISYGYDVNGQLCIMAINNLIDADLDSTANYVLRAFEDYPGVLKTKELVKAFNDGYEYGKQGVKIYQTTSNGLEYDISYSPKGNIVFSVTTVESIE